jgi:hypothetical protein
MSTGAVQPVVDSVAGLRDRCAHGTFSGRTVGVSRRARNVAFTLQTLTELLLRLSNMLAENVPACSLVSAEVAYRPVDRLIISPGN